MVNKGKFCSSNGSTSFVLGEGEVPDKSFFRTEFAPEKIQKGMFAVFISVIIFVVTLVLAYMRSVYAKI